MSPAWNRRYLTSWRRGRPQAGGEAKKEGKCNSGKHRQISLWGTQQSGQLQRFIVITVWAYHNRPVLSAPSLTVLADMAFNRCNRLGPVAQRSEQETHNAIHWFNSSRNTLKNKWFHVLANPLQPPKTLVAGVRTLTPAGYRIGVRRFAVSHLTSH